MSKTECNQSSFTFHPFGRRAVVARFDGGTQVEKRTVVAWKYGCFVLDSVFSEDADQRLEPTLPRC